MNEHEFMISAHERFVKWVELLRDTKGLWFITITLKPKLYKYSSVTQYEMSVNIVEAILRNHTDSYVLVTELTASANIHYHAIIQIRDKYQMCTLLNKIKRVRELGNSKVNDKPVVELQRTFEYMLKEVNVTRKVISTPNYKPEVLKFDYENINN